MFNNKMSDKEKCINSLNNIEKVMHTLVVWSNVFYILAAIMAFIGGYNILGILFLIVAVVSTIHHANLNFVLSQYIWGKLDVTIANIVGIGAMIYASWYVIKNKEYKDRRNIVLYISIFVLAILSITAFALSHQSIKPEDLPQDEEKGFTGPIFADMKSTQEYTCEQKAKIIMYLVYHTIWHMLGGIAGMFLVLVIVK